MSRKIGAPHRATGEIDKIGITSNKNGGRGRYSQSYLDLEGVDYLTIHKFQSRYPAIVAENIALVGYFSQYGRLPRLNKVFR